MNKNSKIYIAGHRGLVGSAIVKLGWSREYKLEALVNDMMQSDLKLMTKDVYLKDGGNL